MDPATKLAAARTRLILDRPFLGALVLRLPLEIGNDAWCQTTATDARAFYYNPDYIRSLDPDECEFMLCHEALHCALSHFSRRGHRQTRVWDQACDYAINPILIAEGLVAPAGSLVDSQYEGMSAEEIYPLLLESPPQQEPLDQHLYDDDGSERDEPGYPDNEAKQELDDCGGESAPLDMDPVEAESAADPLPGLARPLPLDAREREALSIAWQQRVAGAAQQARQAGRISRRLAELADLLLQPNLPWRMLLARFMSSVARDEHSYARPSTRRGEPAIFPALRGSQINLALALDVSGSITLDELSEFAAEVNAVKGQIKARVTVLLCDQELQNDPWIFEPWENLEMPDKLPAGGGTDFRPVFDHLNRADIAPDALVYFTDAKGRFPVQVPHYPVVWLVKGSHDVPWGERIQLN